MTYKQYGALNSMDFLDFLGGLGSSPGKFMQTWKT